MRVLTTNGVWFLAPVDALGASDVGRHWNAVRRYLDTGNDDDLAGFAGIELEGVDQDGTRHRVALATDPDSIEIHAMRGDVRFESIYDEVQ